MTKLIDLRGETAVVTGGARGFGREIARHLALAGADVMIVDIREELAMEVAAAISDETGQQVRAVYGDVTRLEDVVRLRDQALRLMGKVDVLVNDAAWERAIPFIDMTPDLWDRVMAVNFKSVVHASHTFLPHMISRRHGSIVNLVSDAGLFGRVGEVVYSAAFGAVVAFSRALAREYAGDGIAVGVVCPACAHTDLAWEVAPCTPSGRIATPDEVASRVAMLASSGVAVG